ncbi:MAG: MarR family transcriptional regulator [Hyphomicrobiales bacterium]|nr:MAG: MarR family transcriptional regulator [Hyphomicrobiales bacterium]
MSCMKHADLRREILFELSDVARAMRTHIDQRARQHGMTRAQWAVLARVQRQEGATQTELAEALEIQPISLVRLVDRLCAQGLVERRAHAKDRRVNLLHLTDRGRDLLAELTPLGRDIAREILDELSESQTLDLLHKLLLMKRNIKSASAKHVANGAEQGGRDAEAR